jgi:hypothetical protein
MDLQMLLGDLSAVPGPHFIELETRTGIPKNLPRPSESLPELLSDFRAAIESDAKV